MKRVNLLPPEAIKKGFWDWVVIAFFHSPRTRMGLVGVVIFIGLNLWQFGVLLQSRYALSSEKKHMTVVQQEVKTAQKSAMQITGEKEMVSKEIKRLQSTLKILDEVKKEVYPFAAMLKAVTEMVPKDLWFTRLHLKQDVVTLTGSATTQAAISSFMKKMDESPDFENTGFNYTEKSTKSETGQILFQVVTHYLRHEN